MSQLATAMTAAAATTEAELDRLLPPATGPLARLGEAMRYAALGGGKRLRPLLVHACAGLGRGAPAAAVARVGAAIELVHAYSLVHDDLPAMDDAQLRRSRPACHRVFGEAIAILAGDALQALAFEALARDDWPGAPTLRTSLVGGLGRAAGPLGMCGGQLLDLSDDPTRGEPERIAYMERLKTGAMIAFACDAGAQLASLPAAERQRLAAFAQDLGLAFQIKDDLLDTEGDGTTTGKDAGLDAERGKATLVGALGIDGARARLDLLAQAAGAQLDIFGSRATLLREILVFVVQRDV